MPYIGHECTKLLNRRKAEGQIKEFAYLDFHMRVKKILLDVVTSLLSALPAAEKSYSLGFTSPSPNCQAC